MLSLIGVAVTPGTALADPTCFRAPGQNENGDPTAEVCYEVGETIHGQPRVWIQVDVPGVGVVRVTVGPDGRPLSWIVACVSVAQNPQTCV